MYKATVVGGAGFLGRSLVGKLLENDFRVSVADIVVNDGELPYSLKSLQDYFRDGQLKCSPLDVTDESTYTTIPGDTDVLFHLAGRFRFWPIDDELSYRVNVKGTMGLAEYCINHPNIKTMVHYSSIEAVGSVSDRSAPPGANENSLPADEDLVDCPYKKTKTIAHKSLIERAGDFGKYGKRLLIHCPPTAIGPGMETVATGNLLTKDIWICPSTTLSCASSSDIARDDLLMLEKGENGGIYVSVGFHASFPEILRTKAEIMSSEYNIPLRKDVLTLPDWSLMWLARGMEVYSKLNRHYVPDMTKEQAIRSGQNHYYDTSWTREQLGLEQEDYMDLEETVRTACHYLKDEGFLNI